MHHIRDFKGILMQNKGKIKSCKCHKQPIKPTEWDVIGHKQVNNSGRKICLNRSAEAVQMALCIPWMTSDQCCFHNPQACNQAFIKLLCTELECAAAFKV